MRGIVNNSDIYPCAEVTSLERKNECFADAEQLFTQHYYVPEEETNKADSALFRVYSTVQGQVVTNAEARFNNSLRPRKPEGSLGLTAQDVHLDSHTAPELWNHAVAGSVYISANSVVFLGG